MRSKKALTLVSSLLLLGLASCGGRRSQCNQLITPINQAQTFRADYEQSMAEALAQISSAADLAQTKAAAQQYIAAVDTTTDNTTDLVEDIESTNITDPQLLEYRNRYTTLIIQWTDALTNARNAMRLAENAESDASFQEDFIRLQRQIDSAFSAIQTISAQEAPLIEEINTYCTAPTE
ncbi:MAG: hypothetical protein AAFU53_13525 [Cyanobacteria bacterium J06632_3]